MDRDAAVVAMRERGVDTKPYLPAIHLFSFYRERFGHREGEFPVCEDVAARSLALPFFPELTDGSGGAGGRGAARGHRPTGLTRATKPGRLRLGGPVGHLVEARVRVERPRGLVVHRGVERDRRQGARTRLALGLVQERPRGAPAAKRGVRGE